MIYFISLKKLFFNMSKNKPVPIGCSESCCSEKSKSWLFIIKDFGEADSKQPAHIVRLRHPKTRDGALYMFSPKNETVQEILTCDEPKRSYFVGSEVKSDGRFFLSTPIDPLFFALPYLKEYGRCSPLDHILADEEYPETERLLNCTGLKYIHQIADKRGEDSLNAYIYNEEKVLNWLEKKIKRVASALKGKGYHVSSQSAISANFVVNKDATDSNESYLRYAFGLVSDYLPDSITSALGSHLNLPLADVEKKAPENGNVLKERNKRKRAEEDNETYFAASPVLPKEKKATPSAKAKAMAKAASGSKSIMSFFSKK